MDGLSLIRLLSESSADVSAETETEAKVLGLIQRVPAARPAALAALATLLGKLHEPGGGGGGGGSRDEGAAESEEMQRRKRPRTDNAPGLLRRARAASLSVDQPHTYASARVVCVFFPTHERWPSFFRLLTSHPTRVLGTNRLTRSAAGCERPGQAWRHPQNSTRHAHLTNG